MSENIQNRRTLEEIRESVRAHLPELEKRFGVIYLGIFGSWARGESRAGSDLDILVDFDDPPGLFGFIDLQERLAEIAGVKVDLVMKSALKPRIGERILKEVVSV